MPRLFLLRHAVAERARPGESDHERALTKDGRKDSAAIGKIIAERGDGIDLVLVSDSRRTRETFEGVAPALKEAPEVRHLRSIFEADDTYIPILRKEGGDARTILLVGHNPAIQATAVRLPADLASRDGRALRERFPKAALAVLEFDGGWGTLQPRQARLVETVEAEE